MRSGALAENLFKMDREAIAHELGFDSVLPNSLNAVADRDFVLEIMQWGPFLMMHAEELIIYSSLGFGFVRLHDMYSTGSILMP